MKIHPLLLVLFLATTSLSMAQGLGSLSFGFSNQTNQLIQFTGSGDTITFGSDSNGHGFFVSDSNDSGLLNLTGSIEGILHVDTAHVSSGVLLPGVSYDSAPIVTVVSSTLKLYDNAGHAFTADVDWGQVLRVGATGSLNPNSEVNLSNFQYSGTFAPLVNLLTSHTGVATVTFQFQRAITLSDLLQDGTTTFATYSGVATTDALYSPIPEPSTYAAVLGGMALLGVSILRRQRGLAVV